MPRETLSLPSFVWVCVFTKSRASIPSAEGCRSQTKVSIDDELRLGFRLGRFVCVCNSTRNCTVKFEAGYLLAALLRKGSLSLFEFCSILPGVIDHYIRFKTGGVISCATNCVKPLTCNIESYSWYKLRFERENKLQTYEISNQILNLISLNLTLINKSYVQCFDTLNTLN